jgi:hypothetical protein
MELNELKELLDYNPDTGIFTNKITRNSRAVKGMQAGSSCATNIYRILTINKVKYLEHRLAWFYIHGTWPENQIDHINGIKNDNRKCNLREATASQNHANIKMKKGYTKVGNKYRARIEVNKEQIHLGYFNTKEEAISVYKKAHKEYFCDFSY